MSIKVLVADDSITIQKVIGIIFGGEEYSLTVVDNGKAAVDKARELAPDILLVDALMPVMTGYEVAEMIRATPALAAMPILLMTGSFEPFDEEKAKKCGADDFIAKPFESQQIIAKVQEMLERSASRPVAAAQTAVEPEPFQASEMSPPAFDIPAPLEPAVEQTSVSDIWGAFTPEIEQPAAVDDVPPPLPAGDSEPDVFAIVTEEDDALFVAPSSPPPIQQPSHTGSQWVPVEENTFDFEDAIAEPPLSAFSEQPVQVEETSFGDISFDDVPEAPPVQTVSLPEEPPVVTVPESAFADLPEAPAAFEPAIPPSTRFEPLPDPAPAPAPMAASAPESVPAAVQLTEEQLKAALAGVSQEIIERIVWEVVPDLAEAMIREAIRKIREGI